MAPLPRGHCLLATLSLPVDEMQQELRVRGEEGGFRGAGFGHLDSAHPWSDYCDQVLYRRDKFRRQAADNTEVRFRLGKAQVARGQRSEVICIHQGSSNTLKLGFHILK